MTLTGSWCTLEEAESKFGVKKALLMKWVEEGLVRSENESGRVQFINIDDIELKIDELVKT